MFDQSKEKNSPELWDKIFKPRNELLDLYDLRKEELSMVYERMEKILLDKFGSLKGLKVVEVGAGRGVCSALLAKKGAEIYILDYSENALQQSRNFFVHNGLEAHFINSNALDLKSDLLSNFDISLSFGLAEHFRGESRKQIIKSHFLLLKKGGVSFISVPNKYCIPYRIFKSVAEFLKAWTVGEEYPFSRKELKEIAMSSGLVGDCFFTANSIYSSLGFLNPKLAYYYYFNKKPVITKEKIKKLKKEKGTFLDEYLAYALILVGIRK